MEREELKTYISSIAPDLEFDETCKDYLIGIVDSGNFRPLSELLRNDPKLKLDFLFCLSGVDYPEADQLIVVYHLRSTEFHHTFCLKAKIQGRDNPSVDTVSDIWATAEFHEREAYDFYGIVFNNHPDLRRIFLEDDWKGWPMRRDYVDHVNIIER